MNLVLALLFYIMLIINWKACRWIVKQKQVQSAYIVYLEQCNDQLAGLHSLPKENIE